MSEQADSFHVRADRIEDVATWLEDSRVLGLVLPRTGAFVTVLVPSHHIGTVIAASTYLAVFYEYHDGVRVSARLYDGPRELAHLERSFEGKQESRFEARAWLKQRVLDRARAKALAKGLRAAWPERSERHWVADALGLSDVAWATGEELMTRRAELVARWPGAILVEAGDPRVDAERRVVRATPSAPAAVVPAPEPAKVPRGLSALLAADITPVPLRTSARAPEPPPPARARPTPAPAPAPAVVARAPSPPPSPSPSPPPPEPPPPIRAATPTPVSVPPGEELARAKRRGRTGGDPLAFLDELDSGIASALTPPPPAGPSSLSQLPLTDEFASGNFPAVPRAESAAGKPVLVHARSLVLCSMSRQRQALLREDPALADILVEARHEETVPGLLDLGSRANDLAHVLVTAGEDLLEALRATTSRRIDGSQARLLDKRAVARIAALFDEVDQEALALTAARTYRLADDLRALIELYTSAAANGHAILVAVE